MRNKTIDLLATAVAIGILTLRAPLVNAQTSAARPEFDVASVKRNTACGGRRGGGSQPAPGRLDMACTTLQNLIENAYGAFANGVTVNPGLLDILGGPNWMESDNYDVVAKAEDNTPIARMAGPMMQALLEDRFKLKIHRETKEVPVYFLTLGKGGPKLERTKEGSCVILDLNHLPPPPAPGQPRPNMCGNFGMASKGSTLTMSSRGMTMEVLASRALSRFAGRPTFDRTGLTGQFDIQLEFTPDGMLGMAGRGAPGESDNPSQPVDPAPSIFDALQQLGLRLEPAKGPVEVLVIDHVERPSEN